MSSSSAALSRASSVRATICCRVAVRCDRPRNRKLTAQCSIVVNRFLKPTRYITCTTSHISQAMNPENLILSPMAQTAWNREMVAMLPLSKYLKGCPAGCPASRFLI